MEHKLYIRSTDKDEIEILTFFFLHSLTFRIISFQKNECVDKSIQFIVNLYGNIPATAGFDLGQKYNADLNYIQWHRDTDSKEWQQAKAFKVNLYVEQPEQK